MEKAIELAIIILGLYYIGVPIFRRQGYKTGLSESVGMDGFHRLLVRKDNAYAAIKDIRFDHQTGKISEEDYRELMAKYEAEAVDVLKKIDSFRKGMDKGAGRKKGKK
ncbi:MAG: hypothetical protein HZA01_01750 [Nitrospinae bacterium]|nr:hypothetical protein [Nitrospinota bacterium]